MTLRIRAAGSLTIKSGPLSTPFDLECRDLALTESRQGEPGLVVGFPDGSLLATVENPYGHSGNPIRPPR